MSRYVRSDCHLQRHPRRHAKANVATSILDMPPVVPSPPEMMKSLPMNYQNQRIWDMPRALPDHKGVDDCWPNQGVKDLMLIDPLPRTLPAGKDDSVFISLPCQQSLGRRWRPCAICNWRLRWTTFGPGCCTSCCNDCKCWCGGTGHSMIPIPPPLNNDDVAIRG